VVLPEPDDQELDCGERYERQPSNPASSLAGRVLAAGSGAVRGRAGVLIVRRSLGVALWTLAGLVACVFGALSALVGTHRGRALLARAGEAALQRVFSGSVEVGNVSGALLTGLTLSDVRLFDPDTTLVAWLPRE